MKAIIQRRKASEEGFTLIELMVVVLIIAILLAIAIPTFLGAQNKAKDRAAQSSARNALTNAKTIYADTGNYKTAINTELTKIEPALTFVASDAASAGPKFVSVLTDTTDGITWIGAVKSETGTCFYIKDSIATSGGGTSFGKMTISTVSNSTSTCTAADTVTSYSTVGW